MAHILASNDSFLPETSPIQFTAVPKLKIMIAYFSEVRDVEAALNAVILPDIGCLP